MAGTVGALSPSFLPDRRIVFSRRVKPYSRGSLFDERGAWQIVSVREDGSDSRIEGGDDANSYGDRPRARRRARSSHTARAPRTTSGSFSSGGRRFGARCAGHRPSLGAVIRSAATPEERGARRGSHHLQDERAHRRRVPCAPQSARRLQLLARREVDRVQPRRGRHAFQQGDQQQRLEDALPDGTELTNLTHDSAVDDGCRASPATANGSFSARRSRSLRPLSDEAGRTSACASSRTTAPKTISMRPSRRRRIGLRSSNGAAPLDRLRRLCHGATTNDRSIRSIRRSPPPTVAQRRFLARRQDRSCSHRSKAASPTRNTCTPSREAYDGSFASPSPTARRAASPTTEWEEEHAVVPERRSGALILPDDPRPPASYPADLYRLSTTTCRPSRRPSS